MVLQTRGESKIKYSKIGKISKLNLFRNSDRKSEDFQSETCETEEKNSKRQSLANFRHFQAKQNFPDKNCFSPLFILADTIATVVGLYNFWVSISLLIFQVKYQIFGERGALHGNRKHSSDIRPVYIGPL